MAPTAAGLLVVLALGAAGEPNPYLAQAKVFYQGVDYENCLKRLEQAVRWENSRQELVEIEIYWGLCQFEDAARTAERHFALALQLDPEARLPPFTSPKVVEVFKTVAAKTPKPAPPPPEDAPRVAVLEPPPKPPPPVTATAKPRSGFRRPGPIPLGLGAAAVLAGGATAYFGITAKQNETASNNATFALDGAQYANQAYFNSSAANVSLAVAGACAIAAVVVYFVQAGPAEESR